ncbi:MAG: TetR/AcrR family transcriptional regulator [Bacteroidota bacterium]
MQKTSIKDQILETASLLFYKNGYNSTGINEIIEKTGIAKATLYHHFKSKEAICIAYLDSRHKTFIGQLTTHVKSNPLGKNQLLAIFDFLRNLYRRDEFYGCWAQKTLGELSPKDKKIHGVIQKQKKELLLFLGDVVGDNIAHVSKAEVEKISGGIYLLFESAITESHLHQNDWPIYLAKSIAPSLFSGAKLKQ